MHPRRLFHIFATLMLAARACFGAAPAAADAEFFEKKIRPVLATECYECHGANKQKGGLRLDSRDGWKKGGDSGDVIVLGDAAKSLLIRAIRHEDPDLKMPAKAPKLDDATIANFEKWVNLGAPDPRDSPPAEESANSTWADKLAARKGWWALQPVRKPEAPAAKNGAWSQHPVDRFLLEKMSAKNLAPASDAEPRTLIRRLTFTLTGLPPTPEEVEAFASESIRNPQSAIGNATNRLLASPRFGEHWARHWMDLVRYADTHGSEGDPAIPEAWRYRDYLVRAFNADVPVDRLIREHLAGDLLPDPRCNRDEQINESLLGTAHLRLVEHGFQPIDTLDEQVKTTDSQIDVAMKAFQGLTVTCARCHDHKFDAISQRDYYALFGVFASCHPAMVTIDAPDLLEKNRAELAALKTKIKDALADAWLAETARISEKPGAIEQNPGVKNEPAPAWDFARGDYAKCFHYGTGLGEKPAACGEFSIAPEGDRVLTGLYPAGAMTHALSRKHNGVLTTPRFKIESDFISVRAFGGGGAQVRLISNGYPLGNGSIFPRAQIDKDEPTWFTLDVKYRRGTMAYLEFATPSDLTRPENLPKDGRSWFGIERIVFHDAAGKPADSAPVANAAQLTAAIEAWRDGALVEDQRATLDFFVRRGLLPVALAQLENVRPLVADYRRLEAEIPLPRHAPGVLEADSYDAPLLPRGDHLKPGEPVPRAYLDVFGDAPFATSKSGRLELANALADPRNPLTARVAVNRIWQWLFGRGLVPTPDNFGRMGEAPTHPELLDFLAAEFVERGWSTKEMIRLLVVTRAFQMSSESSPAAQDGDPANELLSHFRVRRIEAESIRDALLAVPGNLDFKMFGPGEEANAKRRSVWLAVRRTDLNPFLGVFDAPKPFSTLGRRDATNVPAQSLTMLNSPFVIEQASAWSRELVKSDRDTLESRVHRMFEKALSRPPTDAEITASSAFLGKLASARNLDATQLLGDESVWRDFAQSLFDLKEFIYTR